MKIKNFLIIFTLFIVLLCGVSAISAASDNALDNLTSEMNAMDDSISVSNYENVVGVDDSALNTQEKNREINEQSLDVNSIGILGLQSGGIDLQNLRDSSNQVNISDEEYNLIQSPKHDEINDVEDIIAIEKNSKDNLIGEDNDSLVIYVGQNKSDDGGNGSYENPFQTLELACNNIHGENKVIINLFNGTHKIGTDLVFNATDLTIKGFNGDATIKNLYNVKGTRKTLGSTQSIGLASSNDNIRFENIIWDPSEWTVGTGPRMWFYLLKGGVNQAIFYNCTFMQSGLDPLFSQSNLYKFTKCKFMGIGRFIDASAGDAKLASGSSFDSCVLLVTTTQIFRISENQNINLNFEKTWFGINQLPDYLKYYGTDNYMPIISYAVFNITEKYINETSYEILGRLCWNGTNDTVGDTFGPMIVTLTSSTGDIVSNATLINGTFKVIYTSNSSDNKVTAKLNYENIDLIFTNLNMELNSPSIFYGDNQNITINLPQTVNATVNILVNNKTYELRINNSESAIFTIPDTLKEGSYNVDVLLVDEDNHVYASNSTELVVSKVSDYTFAPIVPGDAKVDDIVTIIVELPSDATGTVVVSVGDNNFSADASANVEINITGLVAGDNNIIVTYSGDDKYVNKSSESILTAEKVELDTNETLNVETPEGTVNPEFSIALPNDATGNLTVIVNNKTYTQKLVNGSAKITVDDLTPGDYNATIIYSGDDKYNSIVSNTTVSVPKPVLTAKNISLLYTSGTKYTVQVKVDGKPVTGKTVNFVINGKKTTAKTNNNGYASVKITLPPKSNAYKVTANYLGVKVTNKVTVKSIVVAKNLKAKKSAKTLKIKVTLKKVNKKYLKGKKVTLKFKGKTYKVKTNKKGVATFTIKKNVLNKLKVGKKYTYKVTYGKDSVNKKITIKK